jgi:hypothetical protein
MTNAGLVVLGLWIYVGLALCALSYEGASARAANVVIDQKGAWIMFGLPFLMALLGTIGILATSA